MTLTKILKLKKPDYYDPADIMIVNGNMDIIDKKVEDIDTDIENINREISNINSYNVCSTAAATVSKIVTLSGFTLLTGAKVTVKFTITNTAADPTLNVNGTGAKAIYYRGAAITAGLLVANGVYDFVYDGIYWQLVGAADAYTKAEVDALLNGITTRYNTCLTAAATVTKIVALSGFVLVTGAKVTVKFTITNTAADPTLNVNGTGAKAIYYRGAAITAGLLVANGVYDFIYDGTYWQLVGTADTYTRLEIDTQMDKKENLIKDVTAKTTPVDADALPLIDSAASNATKKVTWSNIKNTLKSFIYGLYHGYVTCSTAAGTAAKTVTLSGFALETGVSVKVKFTNTNTAAATTLNVNSTGAKSIFYKGAAISADLLAANVIYEFVYDGTQFNLVGTVDIYTKAETDTQLNNKVSRNFINNWYFPNPVNQRTVSGTITTPGYFIDRWKLISGSVTLTNSGLTLSGTIVQILETAVGTNVIASVKMYSGTANASYDNGTKTFTITSSGGIINSVKLEIGEVSTLAYDPPMDFGKELAVCQRYYETSWSANLPLKKDYHGFTLLHGRLQQTYLEANFPFKIPKRVTPVMSIFSYNMTPNTVSRDDSSRSDAASPNAVAAYGTTGFVHLIFSAGAITEGERYGCKWIADADL